MPTNPSRSLFLNLPVRDLKKTMAFFSKLGFEFNPQFTDETATCMLIGPSAYAMLLTEPKFKEFAKKPVGDATKQTAGMYAISMDSRAEVDDVFDKALAAGATVAAPTVDHGFMYNRSFYDLDGHHWELFWMDPKALQK